MTPVNQALLTILVCPKCRAGVEQVEDTIRCRNPQCGLVYPVRDGIPVMLVDAAKPAARP